MHVLLSTEVVQKNTRIPSFSFPQWNVGRLLPEAWRNNNWPCRCALSRKHLLVRCVRLDIQENRRLCLRCITVTTRGWMDGWLAKGLDGWMEKRMDVSTPRPQLTSWCWLMVEMCARVWSVQAGTPSLRQLGVSRDMDGRWAFDWGSSTAPGQRPHAQCVLLADSFQLLGAHGVRDEL